jgi:Protein of unknown function (DUF2950)
MVTEVPRTSLEGRREVTRFPIGSQVPGNKLADRAGIWSAVAAEELAGAIGLAERVRVTEVVAQALATGRAEAEQIGSEAGTFRAAAAETAMRSEGVPEAPAVTTDRAPAPAAAAVLRAWDLAEVVAVEAAEGDAGEQPGSHEGIHRSMDMKSTSARTSFLWTLWIAGALAVLPAPDQLAAQQPAATTTPASVAVAAKTFDTPQQAADALVAAAQQFDERALREIFGPGGEDIVFSGEYPQDRKRASDFAAEAYEKKSVSVDSKKGNRAFLLVGNEDWPFPVPIVKLGTKWAFDAKAGRQELLYRRIGSNELDAIDICRGYVEAQHEYALQKREGYDVNQYAQRIVSTPGKQDGLAWQNPDGSWGGPIGEKVARAIEQGYSVGAEPYHGYFFKILKGQGPAAPLGEMDFVVKGVMIGGFALMAAPAEYGVTGVKSFIVSHDGVLYERDLGPATLNEFIKMERFNPDRSWKPVLEE